MVVGTTPEPKKQPGYSPTTAVSLPALVAASRTNAATFLIGEVFMQVLVVDVGGDHVKILVTGQEAPRKFVSGSSMTA